MKRDNGGEVDANEVDLEQSERASCLLSDSLALSHFPPRVFSFLDFPSHSVAARMASPLPPSTTLHVPDFLRPLLANKTEGFTSCNVRIFFFSF